jgi:alkanesulfonate monooxygenase SsuD/methylene tetrahydromethanopterin reductase-like flavin-dependent oxidoreductase (luciferase family)
VNLFASLDPSDEVAVDRGMRTVGGQFTTREDFDSRTIMGSPATFVRRLAEYRAAGVNLVEFKLLYDRIDQMVETMRILATAILPAVDERASELAG